jgi:DNA polymerase
MAARFCLHDFETQSACDLKKAGAWVYAEHATTELICLGYVIATGEPVVLTADDLMTPGGELLEMALDPDCYFVAHNVLFEKCIWRNLMVPLGWPFIPSERYHDILASCAMRALPLKLERATSALRLSQQKDTEGTKITLSLSRVNKKTGNYE